MAEKLSRKLARLREQILDIEDTLEKVQPGEMWVCGRVDRELVEVALHHAAGVVGFLETGEGLQEAIDKAYSPSS